MQLLIPDRINHRRSYGDKDGLDFEVIMELKSMGMGLKEIQLLFALKRAYGCGDRELVARTFLHLSDHLDALRQEEAALRLRRQKLEGQLEQVKRLLD